MWNDGKVQKSLMGGGGFNISRRNITANSSIDENGSMLNLKMTEIRTLRAVTTCWCKVRGPANWEDSRKW